MEQEPDLKREAMLERVAARSTPWDIVVIGVAGPGAGVAVDAAARAFNVLLLEREDFGKGTSSRNTKLEGVVLQLWDHSVRTS